MMSSKVTYRKQYTRCGKQRCRKCREGEGHGPYWYAYWSEKGRTVSKYIGAQLPEHAEPGGQFVGEIESPPTYGVGAPHNLATQGPSTPLLRIYLLGQFRIEHQSDSQWRTIDSRTWRRRRARALLGCLLSNPGRRLGREQIMELLWPDLDIDVAANRLNGAVHELRQILEPDIVRPAASRLLRLERDILELADSNTIWVDAEAFEKLLKEAHACNDLEQAEHLLEEADVLYRGSYLLEELYSEWATPRRDALQRSWVGLLLKLADLRAERGSHIRAIETLDKLRTAEPTNETALQRLMILLTHLDRRGEALQAYQQHAQMLQRDYESKPLPETSKLYEDLRQGHLPAIYTSITPITLPSPSLKEKAPTNVPTAAPEPPPSASPQEIPFLRPLLQLGRHNQSPLIGRTHELEVMRQVLLAIEEPSHKSAPTARKDLRNSYHTRHIPPVTAHAKQSHFLLLKGETGIGKTRLAEELSLEAYTRGWAVAWSRSYEQESAIPYRPWTELLRTLLHEMPSFTELLNSAQPAGISSTLFSSPLKFERLDALLPELTFHTSTSIPRPAPPISHDQERLLLWEATLGLLSIISKIHPLLLVLDDLHWADESSIELLTYLTHHLQNQQVLLVGTCRDGELTPTHKLSTLITDLRREQTIATVTVKPLTNAQISTLLSHLPGNIVQSIQTQAAGNPFFAEELARYVGANYSDEPIFMPIASFNEQPEIPSTLRTPGSTMPQTAGQDTIHSNRSLPAAIAAVLERRLHRLSNGCQALLGRAAVLGGSFELGQLLPMTGEYDEDTVLDLLEEALNAGLLTEEGTGSHITYHFWHPLIISHLYERLSAARRAQLHRKAARAIKLASVSTPQEKMAATIAYHLSRGGGDPASIAYYAELAGHQAYALAAYSEALQYYFQVIQTFIGNPLFTTDIAEILTQIKQVTPQTLEQVTLTDPQHLCRLLEQIADCCLIFSSFANARHLYECILHLRTNKNFQHQLALTAAGQEDIERHEAQMQALLWREIGNTWAAVSEYAQANACYEQGRQILYQAGISSGSAWACLRLQHGDMLRLEGHYQEARHSLQEALAMLEYNARQAATNGETDIQATYTNAEMRQELSLKDHPTRTELALRGGPLEIGYAHERLGVLEACDSQLSDALKHFHIALSIYEQSELVSIMIRLCSNMGAAYLMQGDLNSARTYLYRALTLSERAGNLPNIACSMDNLGDVAHRSGDLLEAETLLKQSLVLAENVNREKQNWFSVDLAAVQQDLGKLDEAKASVLHALTIGRALKSFRCVGHALVRLGELRVVEAMQVCQWPPLNDEASSQLPLHSQRLLLRASATLRRALYFDGMERAHILEGKRLLATVYFLQNELEIAQCMASRVLKEAREQDGIRIIGRAHSLLGSIMAARKHYEQAERFFKKAMLAFREHDHKLDYARALYGYGLMQVQQGRLSLGKRAEMFLQGNQLDSLYQQGMEHLHEAQTIFAACHAAFDLKQVENLLARIEIYNAQWQTRDVPLSTTASHTRGEHIANEL